MRTGTCFITTDFHFEDYDYDTLPPPGQRQKELSSPWGQPFRDVLVCALLFTSRREYHAGKHSGLPAIASSPGFPLTVGK
jgi:hypothetical protein